MAIRNGSELTINTMNTTLETPSYFSIAGYGPFIVEDSTLNIINKHPNGIAVAVRDLWAGKSTTDDTVEIKNSTIHFEGMQGIRGYSANISDSTITIGDNTKLALIGEHGEVEITNTTFTGITADYFVTADNPTKYKVYGDTVLPADLKIAFGGMLSIPEDASLTIPEGVTLTNEGTMHIYAPEALDGAGTLEGDGTFLIDVTADLIDIPDPFCYTGKELNDKITLQDTLKVMDKSFAADIDGWELDADTLGTVKEIGEYTVKYIKDGQSIEKNFTVEMSAADVSAKTYNGDTETDTFTVDDTITIKATSTATGEAPKKARVRGSYTAPTTGQMALFLNDTQISDAVSAQADGSYTMTVNASDVLSVGNEEPNGDSIPLTAKFVGNNSMADAETTVDVTITADAKLTMPDGTTRYVGNLPDAFEEENSGATVTLIKDVKGRNKTIGIYNSFNNTDLQFTLDLNGHSLHSEYEACEVKEHCSLTIIGDGIISAVQGIFIDKGTVNIKGGTIVGTVEAGVWVSHGGTLIVSGDAQIKGGTSSELGCGVYIINPLKVSLSGGTFSGAAGAIVYSADQGDSLLDFLDQSGADRYAYFHGNTPITEDLVAEKNGYYLTLTGTVTVKPCTDHVWEAKHIESTGTHNQTCLACGLVEDAVKCSYTYTGIGTTQIGTCICGSIVKISLDNTSDLVYNGSVHTPDVTVTLDGQTLTKNTDYTTTYQNNKNAGKASVQIKGLADYSSIDKEMEFTIAPKSLSVVSATAEDREYDATKTVHITDVALEGMVEGDEVKVDMDADTDGITGIINSADAGSYTTVSLPQNLTLAGVEKDNYTLTQPTEAVQTNVTIRKAQGTLTVSATSVIKTYGAEDFSLHCTTEGDGQI
ncbi:MAG: hypothetical protein K2M91_05255, partial [Lachnospiraceae bacterium]|nr:hypothetical protein [Lachnospiraceae bacterium]